MKRDMDIESVLKRAYRRRLLPFVLTFFASVSVSVLIVEMLK